MTDSRAARPIWITLEELVKACEGDTDTLLRLESRWDAAPADATEAATAAAREVLEINKVVTLGAERHMARAVLAALGWAPDES